MKARRPCFFFVLLFLLGSFLPYLVNVQAVQDSTADTPESAADALYALGLFKGKSVTDGVPDYALADSCTRNEAAIMLIRLLGKETKAEAQFANFTMPFSDVPGWAAPAVLWLYENAYLNGTSATTFSGSDPINVQQFSALLLRSLGYSEGNGDFTYQNAVSFAVEKKLLTEAESQTWENKFNRGCVALMCCRALSQNMRRSELTLMDKLESWGVFSGNHDAVADTAAMTLTLKYAGGGSISKWSVEEADIGTPQFGDIDGDGKNELLFASRTIFCLDAATGQTKWSAPSGHSASEQDAAAYGGLSAQPRLVDVNGDGKLEYVSFNTVWTEGTIIGIYDGFGNLLQSWKTPKAVRAAHIADLNRDGKQEIVVAFGVGASRDPAVYVYDCTGKLLPGWPQDMGYGTYCDGIETADMDGDGDLEILLMNDAEYIYAFHHTGKPVLATGGMYAGMEWNWLPVCESYSHEETLADWAAGHGGASSATSDLIIGNTRERRNCIMGTYGGIVADDLDGDGREELAITTMIADGGLVMRNGGETFDGVRQYYTIFLLNTDRTRYKNEDKGFDWTEMPTDVGTPVVYNESALPLPSLRPITCDLDLDGNKEILYSSADGMVHCWHLDGTEHGAWPYAVDTRTSEYLAFATVPQTADLNGDGYPEVVFATYTQNNQIEEQGKLYVLDHTGKLLASISMPYWWGCDVEMYYADGCRATPCIADVDGDGDLEIALTTQTNGLVVYEVS